MLDGTWRVVYTSNSELSILLALASRLPLLEVGDLTQTIDSAAMTVENRVSAPALLHDRRNLYFPRFPTALSMHPCQPCQPCQRAMPQLPCITHGPAWGRSSQSRLLGF